MVFIKRGAQQRINRINEPPILPPFVPPPPPPSSDPLDYGADDEDPNDASVNQMLVPRSHHEDATRILNNLLKEYDKTLRPDIGG